MGNMKVPAHISVGSIYAVPGISGKNRLTIRVTRIISARKMDSGREFVTVIAYRVRPNAHNVSFGKEKLYIASPNEYELLKYTPER